MRPRSVTSRGIAAAAAALVTLGAANAAAIGVAPGAATPVQREQAQARFLRGKQLYDRRHYAEALGEFRAAIDIVASPNARLYVARCLRETGQLVDAYAEFGRTAVEAREHVTEDPRYGRTGESAAVERDALAAKLGFLTIHVSRAADTTTLHVGDDEIGRAAWGEATPVVPGTTTITVQTPPRDPVRQVVTAAAGQKLTLELDAEAGVAEEIVATSSPGPTPADHGLRPWAYVAGGVGAFGLVTFAVAGLLSNSAYGDLSSQCPSSACPASKSGEISSGRTEQMVANVGLVVGVLGVAAGVTIFAISAPPKASTTARLVWTGSSFLVRGTF